jgi:Fe-S-cluster-containing dehydrogenase component
LHCQDPECLTGCPTGAIGRFPGGQIDIQPKICIGCGDCATQCPYNAISMVPRTPTANAPSVGGRLLSWFDLSPPDPPRAVTETEDLLAVKCNLCNNTPLNPAHKKSRAFSCQESCPTGALVRVNPREYFAEAKNAIGIVFKDQTHAIGRNIHRRDTPALVFHRGCWRFWLWSRRFGPRAKYTLDGHLEGTAADAQMDHGLMVWKHCGRVSYSARKQIYTRRAGPLRYWKLAHVYLGVLAGMILLIHGGRDSGGLLTRC